MCLRQRQVTILRQRQVDGAVLVGSSYQGELGEQKISEFLGHVPIISANGVFDLPNTYSVLMDENDDNSRGFLSFSRNLVLA